MTLSLPCRQRWEAIVSFAADANLSLAFGLNFKLHSDPDNLLAFLNYTRSRDFKVDTFEFGNELGMTP